MKYENGIWTFNKYDVIRKHLIVFSEKLLDEQVNDWFRKYYARNQKHDPEVEDFDRRLCNNLKKKFGFTAKDWGVWLMQAQYSHFFERVNKRYTITSSKGKEVIFDNYNGLWYTATETGAGEHLVMFDYGDFYGLGSVFPLATYFVIRAKSWKDEHENEGNDE